MYTEIIRTTNGNVTKIETVTYSEAFEIAKVAAVSQWTKKIEIFVEATNSWEDIVTWLEVEDEAWWQGVING